MNFFLKVKEIKEMTKKIFILFLLLSVYSCQNVKDALSGKKYESSDEFLVIKKNPLVLPPDFKSLPAPEDPVKKSRKDTIEDEIDDILSSIKSDKSPRDTDENLSSSSSTEDFVLDQIKD